MNLEEIKEAEEREKEYIKSLVRIVSRNSLKGDRAIELIRTVYEGVLALEAKSFGIDYEIGYVDNGFEKYPDNISDQVSEGFFVGGYILGQYENKYDGKKVCFNYDPVYLQKAYFGSSRPERRMLGVYKLTHNIYHELLGHAIDDIFMWQGRPNLDTLEIAQEDIAIQTGLPDNFYKTRYEMLKGENHANLVATNNTMEAVDWQNSDVATSMENMAYLEATVYDMRSLMGKVQYEGKMVLRQELIEKICDLRVKSNPQYLYEQPILQRKYSPDGSKKDLVTLLGDLTYERTRIMTGNITGKPEVLYGECAECEILYYELIRDVLHNATEQDYATVTEKYGIKGIQSFMSSMERYFNMKADKKLEMLKFKHDAIEQGQLHDGDFQTEDEVKAELKKRVNAIVRFRNGLVKNDINEKLLREGGYVRGTRVKEVGMQRKKRIQFVNNLIDVYDSSESEEDYASRVESEQADIDEVIDSLYFNKFEDLLKNKTIEEGEEIAFDSNDISRLVKLLKVSKIMTAETKHDYFDEFLMIPDVYEIVTKFSRNSDTYLREASGKIVARKGKAHHPKTPGENGEYKEYLHMSPSTELDGWTNEILEKREMLDRELEMTRGRGTEYDR